MIGANAPERREEMPTEEEWELEIPSEDTVLGECQDYGDTDPIRQYLQDIGRYPLLTAEEERRLGLAVKAGGPAGPTWNSDIKGRHQGRAEGVRCGVWP